MKTLFVGDVHGKVEIVEDALAQEHPVIFVGDILDSYDRTIDNHLKCLELIFKAIDDGKAQCLFGNHELSYMYEHMRCSGYKPVTQMHMDGGVREDMWKRFKHFIFIKPNLLITHAGLTKQLWDKHHLSLESLEETLLRWSQNIHSPAYNIGAARGGWEIAGGIFWCDWNEEFIPIPGLNQIVGHTRGKTLRQVENSFCIDYNDFKKEFFYYDV
jgi:hypothetical protein